MEEGHGQSSLHSVTYISSPDLTCLTHPRLLLQQLAVVLVVLVSKLAFWGGGARLSARAWPLAMLCDQ